MANDSQELLDALGVLTRPNVLEMSRRLRVARNTVQARLDRLHERGVIAGYGPLLDVRALGYRVLAFITLEIAQGREADALAVLSGIGEVFEIHKITGPGDLLLRVIARDNEHLHDVVESILTAPGITRTTTSLALNSPVVRVHPDATAVGRLQ